MMEISGLTAEGDEFNAVEWKSVSDGEFLECSFVGVVLREAAVSRSRFIDCRFERCDLSLWKPVDSLIGASRFENCRMLGIDWTAANWPAVPLYDPNVFVRCDLSMNTFNELRIGPVTMEECRLREASFRFAQLSGASLRGSDCSGADFHGADLRGSNLVGLSGLVVDPRVTTLDGATVDATTGAAILDALGISLDPEPGI